MGRNAVPYYPPAQVLSRSPGAAVGGRQLTACLAADQLGLGKRSERQRMPAINWSHFTCLR